MSVVGIDLEQFVRDPYPTGIQRVLQQLALNWPSDLAEAQFVVPVDERRFALLSPEQAAELLTLPFIDRASDDPEFDAGHALRVDVAVALDAFRADLAIPKVTLGQLISMYDVWLLAEVSYLPSVLHRLEIFSKCMPVVMVAHDALPMTHPENYRIVPGAGANVSEYFRRMASVDAVACVSESSRHEILTRLRRDPALVTTVISNGGDHIPARETTAASNARPVFARLGTMEARKRPQEILRGFLKATEQGLDAELLFIGNPSASSEAINDEVRAAIAAGAPVRWIVGPSDREMHEFIAAADAFLAIGIEGFGLPVLEAIRLGTPVLFDGTQPAADLMNDRGAVRIDASDEDAIAAAFLAWGKPGALDAVRNAIDVSAVPAWSSFAMRLAQLCVAQV